MPLLGFQKQFADDVESGKKTQTIRAHRKYPIKVGDTLYLWTGLRRPGARKLDEVKCTNVVPFEITSSIEEGVFWILDEDCLTHKECEELAKRDGFIDEYEMTDWFEKTHGLPFDGLLIEWEKP